jgi:hypothetical protein
VNPDELRYIGPRPAMQQQAIVRRYRFALGGQHIDAVLTEPAATVWHQARPDATDDELDAWAAERGRRAIRARLERDPLDFGDVLLDEDVGRQRGAEERPRYGQDGAPHR